MSRPQVDRAPKNHTELMLAMGAPKGDGFDPMPPRQIRSLMDRGEHEHIRILAWIWKHSIGNPGKGRKRYPYARDARGILGNQHIASDLNMTPANVSSALKRVFEQGRARRDDEGRICLCGDVADPQLYAEVFDGEDKAKENTESYCTENWHPSLRFYFQQVPQNLNREVAADCAELTAYARKLQADAMKIARDESERLVEEYLAARGFEPPKETRGRPRKAPENPVVQLSLIEAPQLSVQINGFHPQAASVQKPADLLYTAENGTVQKSASLLGFSELQSEQSGVEFPQEGNAAFEAMEEHKEAAAPRPDSLTTPPPTPLQNPPDKTGKAIEQPREAEPDALYDPSPIIESLQRAFKRRLAAHDPLQTKFPELGQQLELPQASVCRWIAEKLEKKESARYKIWTPGALYEFACTDLPKWIATRQREIESDRRWQRQQEQEQAAAAQSAIRAMAAKKGMR